MKRSRAIDRASPLKRTTALKRTRTLDGVGVLLRVVVLRVGALKRAAVILSAVILRIGTLERAYGTVRLLLGLIAILLLLASYLCECDPTAQQRESGQYTLRF